MEFFIHGTVVVNTDSWVFFYTFLLKINLFKIPTYIKCYRLNIGGKSYGKKQNNNNEEQYYRK